MINISKKKALKKWNRAHEFKRKTSTEHKVGHPVYVYGKRGRFFKYLTFTHSPEKGKENDYEELKHNIDFSDKENSSFVKKKYDVSINTKFRASDKKYRIHDDDKELIKKYKK